MRRLAPALSLGVLMAFLAGCVGSAPSPSADWPPQPTRTDQPPGVTLVARGQTVTLANLGTLGVFWPFRIDAWAGPPWRSIRPSEGVEYMNGLYPGDTYRWTFDPRTGPVRVAVRLWPDQTGSGDPWFVWADLPANAPANPSESPLSEYRWALGISNATTMTVAFIVNGTTVGTVGSQELGTYPRSQLPPLPWLVEARSPAGHVLVSMTIRDGDVWESTSSNGGSGFSAPGDRVDLACGRIDIWVGAEMAGPGSPASAPPCPP